jgi:hypothetical protein
MGWAASFDRIAYRGTIGKEGMLAGYFEKDRLQAAASLRGSTELNILGELLKAGAAVSYEQFEDEKLELRTLLPNNP